MSLRRALRPLARATLRRSRRVINATGVIVHTNLGRAPLAEEAIDAVTSVARGYSNLEYDLERGERGSRNAHIEELSAELTGAEAAMAVNNNAAAVMLALAALARDREVVISRGQLVEIGGSFRIPEILAQSGARLVEVGTTNRTRLRDYERAIGPDTAALMRVHSSNFRTVGFTEEVSIEESARSPRSGACVIDDLGSGVIAERDDQLGTALSEEPAARRSVAAGVEVLRDLSGRQGAQQPGVMDRPVVQQVAQRADAEPGAQDLDLLGAKRGQCVQRRHREQRPAGSGRACQSRQRHGKVRTVQAGLGTSRAVGRAYNPHSHLPCNSLNHKGRGTRRQRVEL